MKVFILKNALWVELFLNIYYLKFWKWPTINDKFRSIRTIIHSFAALKVTFNSKNQLQTSLLYKKVCCGDFFWSWRFELSHGSNWPFTRRQFRDLWRDYRLSDVINNFDVKYFFSHVDCKKKTFIDKWKKKSFFFVKLCKFKYLSKKTGNYQRVKTITLVYQNTNIKQNK